MSKYVLILLTLFLSCTVKSKTTRPAIKLLDSGRLQITGIGNDILHEISRDSATTAVWQSLIPVYRMPKDTDLKDYQTPQAGKYVVNDSAVVFTPDTPFLKQQTYFLRFYQFGGGNELLEYMQHRKKLGQVGYTDLDFNR